MHARRHTAVADSFATMDNTDRLLVNHLHSTERVRLELHDGLLKARARLAVGPGCLAGGPCRRVVGCLRGDLLGLDGRDGDGGGRGDAPTSRVLDMEIVPGSVAPTPPRRMNPP